MPALDGSLTTIALGWRLERRDGVTIGLTAHDRDLRVEGLVFRAAPGLVPSALRLSAVDGEESMEAEGPLTDAAIAEADLLAGRWDGARVTVLAIDWTAPADPLVLASGTLGAIETADGRFSVELAGEDAVLDQPVVEETSPTCRAALGDKRCRVPLAAHRRHARVVSVAETTVTLDRAEPVVGAYGGGRLHWFDGANGGLSQAILSSEGDRIVLERPPAFTVGPGALVEVVEGCDKRLETCAVRFGNAVNFRGEPYLPGIDLLTRYPGA